jgi:hypothetical protein
VGLAVVGVVAFTVAFTDGLEVAVAIGLAVAIGFVVALGEAFTLALVVGVGVGFFVAASALVADKARQSASTSADFFSRAPT